MTNTAPPQTYPFDTRALTEPVDRRALTEFARQLKAKHPTSAASVIGFILVGFVVLVIASTTISFMMVALATISEAGPVGFVFSLPVLAIVAFLAIGIPLGIRARRRKHETAYRLSRFAAANGMVYEHEIDDPPLPGMIFQQGSSRESFSLLRGYQPRFVEFANYEYTTGSGKHRRTHHWGYVAVKLDVPLPNIVLDALGNNTLGTNLPSSFARDQRLSLEGNFDQYFTLYCPEGYEADALYLFTPDIMARFIDNAAQLDVEIVDDWMFLYMQRPASTTDAATWAWLFGTVGALMTKFDQWARWRDDRLRRTQAQAAQATPPAPLPAGAPIPPSPTAPAAPLPFAAPAGMLAPPPGVALQGRRLKKSFSWVTVVIVVFVVGFGILPRILDFFLN